MTLVIIDMTIFRVINHLSPDQLDMKSFIVFGISIMFMVFIGSFITAILSPGKTILEVAVACAPIVILSSLLTGNIIGVILGWIMPFLIGLAGAALGEFVSNIIQRKKNTI